MRFKFRKSKDCGGMLKSFLNTEISSYTTSSNKNKRQMPGQEIYLLVKPFFFVFSCHRHNNKQKTKGTKTCLDEKYTCSSNRFFLFFSYHLFKCCCFIFLRPRCFLLAHKQSTKQKGKARETNEWKTNTNFGCIFF